MHSVTPVIDFGGPIAQISNGYNKVDRLAGGGHRVAVKGADAASGRVFIAPFDTLLGIVGAPAGGE